MFSIATYADRRRRLCSQVDSGLVLLPGNSESPMNFADNCYAFRQDSTYLYFIGLDQPDLAATIDTESGRTTVYGDELTIDQIVWMGDLPTLAARAESAGVQEVRPLSALAADLAVAESAGRPIHYVPPYRSENLFMVGQWLGIDPRQVAAGHSLELVKAVVALRSIKSDEEVAEIERAVDISVDMHTAAIKMARPGLRESEIAAEVERVAWAAGTRPSFQVIATINGQILHNHNHANLLKSGDLFLLDAGAESPLHYAGDLSSTFPVDPVFSERQKTIYEITGRAHQAAVDTLAPGVPNRQVHDAACRAVAEGMKGLGLMKGDVDEAVAAGAHAMFFPCGVGHMMGLDVHDMEDLGEVEVGYGGQPKSTEFGLKSLRLARALEPGFVLTVEPGIYFIPQLMDKWRAEGCHLPFLDYAEMDKWRDFGGIRNEEDYLITETGARRLGKPKPMTVDEVEALRAT